MGEQAPRAQRLSMVLSSSETRVLGSLQDPSFLAFARLRLPDKEQRGSQGRMQDLSLPVGAPSSKRVLRDWFLRGHSTSHCGGVPPVPV